MFTSLGYLKRYHHIFCNYIAKDELENLMGWHIVSFVMPAVIHGFTNGVARLVYNRRQFLFPDCDHKSDWFKSEYLIKIKCSFSKFILLSIKCFILAAYCMCLKKGLDLPPILDSTDQIGICDESVIEVIESLTPDHFSLISEHAAGVLLGDSEVEYFLGTEIMEFYLSNEGEILHLFKISC